MLLSRLSEQLASLSARRLVVGYSGGQDSQVLLSALVALKQQQPLPPLAAIHINHNLQAQAAGWQKHCEHYCAAHNIDLTVVNVTIEGDSNIEAKAREARFNAFSQYLGEGDVLLLAQHLQDQSETVLYRLMRGAGVQGLSAIHTQRTLGALQVLRPLLNVDKSDIQSFAKAWQLSFVEDPSNQDQSFDRNYIRQTVMPVLNKRWPKAVQSLQQVASHQQEAQALLTELAEIDLAKTKHQSQLAGVLQPAFIAMGPLIQLSQARQKNALRLFFQNIGVSLTKNARQQLMQLLVKAAGTGQLKLSTLTLFVFGQSIYLVPNRALQKTAQKPLPWKTDKPFVQQGEGSWALLNGEALSLTVGFRQGGETLLINGQNQKVKKLLPQAGVPVFQREFLPFFYHGDNLLAVGNVLLSDHGKALLGENAICFHPEN